MFPSANLPSPDDPIAMLVACHDKVRRFSALVARIGDHVLQKGCDAEAQQAATSVLRYFDVAAPLHHADEEIDLFPALRGLRDSQLNYELDRIEYEHLPLAGLWRDVGHWLSLVQQGSPAEVPSSLLLTFATAYPEHARQEEERLYPHATRLPAPTLAKIGQAMASRRQ
ncbi:hemerythrin domain-containing protein [Parachitinimonas caeni]|uniref:Hemerythrin domain-containing protein n=1 Tax=Parachitinimonas caeni TaxID=3031301 RepID=A0ABT7E2N8_9NEIS|nr:hemerythrin domain-containing protein [Parachitinimonas caeni]MDK2125665.1 hemerythrin domain-containing protein [Parachitinimonas caeni]